jgi:hypothetical protein
MVFFDASAMVNMENMDEEIQSLRSRLKTAIGGLRSIAYGDATTWPNCSSREVAKQALLDCGGEKNTQSNDEVTK